MGPKRSVAALRPHLPKQSGAKRKRGLTGKIEGSPSQDKPFGSGVTRRISSLRSIRSKMPLGLSGADVAIGVTSFTAVGRSCGPRAEPGLSRLLQGGQSSKWPSSSGRRSIIAPARSCSLPCVRSRNGSRPQYAGPVSKLFLRSHPAVLDPFPEPEQFGPEGARSCVVSHCSSWPLPYLPVCLIRDKRWSTPY